MEVLAFTVINKEIECDIKQVVGDNDYQASFMLDDEWNDKEVICRVVWNNRTSLDIALEDLSCVIPAYIMKRGEVSIGVYAEGDEQLTTEPWLLSVRKSIREKEFETAMPHKEIWNEINEKIKNVITNNDLDEKVVLSVNDAIEKSGLVKNDELSTEVNTQVNAYLGENLIDKTESDLISSANLLSIPNDLSKTKYGVTANFDSDNGMIVLNGTYTASWNDSITITTVTLPAGTYNLSVWNLTNIADTSLIAIELLKGTAYKAGFGLNEASNQMSFTTSEETTYNFNIKCKVGFVENGASFGVMIKEGTTAYEFEPYFVPYTETMYTLKDALVQKQIDDINSLKDIVGMSESPLSGLSENGGYVRTFEKIACIGDSLTAGNLDYNGDSFGEYVNDFTSYPLNIARMTGNTVYKLGRGGATAVNSNTAIRENHSWLNIAESNSWLNDEHKANAYIIALGTNDIGYYGSFTGDVSTDIDISDYSNNDSSTSVGGYATIIQRILELQPKAKIFCVTIPNTRNSQTTRSEANEKIRAIAEMLGCYVIDLETYGVQLTDVETWKTKYYNGGHLNALGYVELAKMILTYMNWIIENNADDFRTIGFIDTDYNYS